MAKQQDEQSDKCASLRESPPACFCCSINPPSSAARARSAARRECLHSRSGSPGCCTARLNLESRCSTRRSRRSATWLLPCTLLHGSAAAAPLLHYYVQYCSTPFHRRHGETVPPAALDWGSGRLPVVGLTACGSRWLQGWILVFAWPVVGLCRVAALALEKLTEAFVGRVDVTADDARSQNTPPSHAHRAGRRRCPYRGNVPCGW